MLWFELNHLTIKISQPVKNKNVWGEEHTRGHEGNLNGSAFLAALTGSCWYSALGTSPGEKTLLPPPKGLVDKSSGIVLFNVMNSFSKNSVPSTIGLVYVFLGRLTISFNMFQPWNTNQIRVSENWATVSRFATAHDKFLDDLGLDFLTAKSRIKRNGSNEFPRPPNWSCGRRVGAMAMTAAMGRAGPNARGPGVRGLRAPGLGRCKAQGLGGVSSLEGLGVATHGLKLRTGF